MGWNALYPDRIIRSVYELNWEELAASYEGVIFDIDNTLVPHGAQADEAAIRLFERIHAAGMQTVLVSNNKEPRVKSFADQVKTPYVFKAGKPKKSGYLEALSKMNISAGKALFIGDQIFTDVWGANRTGIYTMLTHPIDKSTDEIQIVIKRWFEKPFIKEKKQQN